MEDAMIGIRSVLPLGEPGPKDVAAVAAATAAR